MKRNNELDTLIKQLEEQIEILKRVNLRKQILLKELQKKLNEA